MKLLQQRRIRCGSFLVKVGLQVPFWLGEEAVGLALYFFNFSTFLGRRGLYLEDLYVQPAWRGKGIGKSLLQALAKVAVEKQCGRMEWAVLDWNTPAIGFYRGLGARILDEWRIVRLDGDGIEALAQS